MTAKASLKIVFICRECGNKNPRWLGRCPECLQWNTYEEQVQAASPASRASIPPSSKPKELDSIKLADTPRLALSYSEFNRVLGGGLVPGSVLLVGGDPGIGKSTLLLQTTAAFAREDRKVLYVSGEESPQQLKLRAQRLGVSGQHLYVQAETDLESILHALDEIHPALAVIDSIQTVSVGEIPSAVGSIGQVRECTQRLMHWAKSNNVPIFITGHVTKEGVIAGPKVLEHIVDVVLYLEGEAFSAYRLLRGVKNRFGSTNEVGVFEMQDHGLVEVGNPSQAFLAERSRGAGSIVVPTIEGTRPLLVEVQALTSPTSFNLPRRTANGIDFNRLLLITAVLTKRLGLPLGSHDIIVNVAGGLRVEEPAADLGVALAIASSYRNTPIDPELVAVGEIGLSSEVRAVSQIERRLSEAGKLGFHRCLLPTSMHSRLAPVEGMELLGVESISEALRTALRKSAQKSPSPNKDGSLWKQN